jgi:FkbH-like protein
MFEFQIPHRQWPRDHLSDEQKVWFRDFDADVTGVSLISWGEHCTECAAPGCYTSCDLYEARADGRCRRFVEGMSAIHGVPNVQGFALRVAFKRWAQLSAHARVHVVPVARARALERGLEALDRLVQRIPGRSRTTLARPQLSRRLAMRLKHEVAHSSWLADPRRRPDYFVVELLNPESTTTRLSLVMQSPRPEAPPPFQRAFDAEPGFHRFKIPYEEIEPHCDDGRELWIHLIPNVTAPEDEGRVLYFGTLGFVADDRARAERLGRRVASSPTARVSPVKAVAWDLDGTLWDGVLLEDGPDGVKLRPEAARLVEALDARGIVQSVVSKNDPEDALAQLRRLGLDEYFVFPRIGFGPKSEAVTGLLADLNIGSDTLAFIDDSAFERAEVAGAHPNVRIHDAVELAELAGRPEFDPAVSESSRDRRAQYRGQERRSAARDAFGGDYESFLLGRLHELVQRTNQLNFSGNRYTREELEALLADPAHEAWALECRDRFGDYGIVGFALAERQPPRLADLALSCRVQGKHVEHAFLCFLLARHAERGEVAFEATHRPTPRNAAAAVVFEDLGFERLAGGEATGDRLRFDLRGELPAERLVSTTHVDAD